MALASRLDSLDEPKASAWLKRLACVALTEDTVDTWRRLALANPWGVPLPTTYAECSAELCALNLRVRYVRRSGRELNFVYTNVDGFNTFRHGLLPYFDERDARHVRWFEHLMALMPSARSACSLLDGKSDVQEDFKTVFARNPMGIHITDDDFVTDAGMSSAIRTVGHMAMKVMWAQRSENVVDMDHDFINHLLQEV